MRDEARRTGTKVHFGRIADFCMEKGSELPKGGMHSANTKGQPLSWGITFEMNMSIELSSPNSVPTLRQWKPPGLLTQWEVSTDIASGTATRKVLTHNHISLASTRGSHCPRIDGQNTGVVRTSPLVPLILALYGHPDAGGRWEAHCEGEILALGFVKIAEEWNSLYWHP